MALNQIFKVSRKTFFNPSGWLGYDMISNNTKAVWNSIKDIFTPAKPQRSESFEESLRRQNISESDLQSLSRNYILYAYVFLALGLISIVFGFYLLISHASFAGWLLAIATATLFFVNAFRFHFWHFQIKHRKLGCTFDEWWQGKPYENKEQ